MALAVLGTGAAARRCGCCFDGKSPPARTGAQACLAQSADPALTRPRAPQDPQTTGRGNACSGTAEPESHTSSKGAARADQPAAQAAQAAVELPSPGRGRLD
eukprot:scaffold4635_cov267-Pinguiococcus_pyrenoidosus.AAC.19